MEGVKALLLDGDDKGNLTSSLADILARATSPSIKLHRARLDKTSRSPRFSSLLARWDPDIVFIVTGPLVSEDGILFVQSLADQLESRPTIAVIDNVEARQMNNLLQRGVSDFITPPLRETNVLPRVWKCHSRSHESHFASDAWCESDNELAQAQKHLHLKGIIGKSSVFLAEVEKVPSIAACDASVLISGETGTGKELFARSIHYLSPRSGSAFVPVNCGAMPSDLAENELFGHERGAYTGAGASHRGLIAEADGGTLFLDEVDSLPPLIQVKLLRFLQEKEYRPLGSTKTKQANVRVVAAANSNLPHRIAKGEFRKDLFYRLNVIPLTLPSLRDRPEDIPVLAEHFLNKCATDLKKPKLAISRGAMEKLISSKWDGNVRELEYVIERATVLSKHSMIRAGDIETAESADQDDLNESGFKTFKAAKEKCITEFEVNYLEQTLLSCHGNISEAARLANKDRRAFFELLRKHNIDATRFKW